MDDHKHVSQSSGQGKFGVIEICGEILYRKSHETDTNDTLKGKSSASVDLSDGRKY